MNALWMAFLFALLGADLLGIGIVETYTVDIGACLFCCVVSTTMLSYHAVARKREAAQGTRSGGKCV